MQVYPFAHGALYQVYAAPGRSPTSRCSPASSSSAPGPIAAGDTVRWIIGDTESGRGDRAQVHILVKPTRPDLMTNLVINTDRRTYHLELRSTRVDLHGLGLLAISAGPAHRACAARTQRAEAAQPVATGVDLLRAQLPLSHRRRPPPWRPLRAFDDGRQVFIEFPRGIGQGEMPPLFVIGPEGRLRARQLPRPRRTTMSSTGCSPPPSCGLAARTASSRVRIVRTDGRPARGVTRDSLRRSEAR